MAVPFLGGSMNQSIQWPGGKADRTADAAGGPHIPEVTLKSTPVRRRAS